ncbi:MAG: lactate utilization protein [Desulfobacterales bacterium]|nr:lactate utilization protein [Desulfobacterales bacterium]
MDNPIEEYWRIRLAKVKSALEGNNFDVFIAEDAKKAGSIVLEDILPTTGAGSVSWGGSMTVGSAGLFDAITARPDLTVVNAFEKDISDQERIERRRQGLLADLFLTGSNAVTEEGQLVNLDMVGNRVGAITFGPKWVVVLVGRNKLVGDIEEAMVRIKTYAAPANAMRLDKKTPCVKTAVCEECASPDRICNSWAITEKSFPKGRIKVILINKSLGL